jgi:energy-coupling factor transport system ATP-binding protein
VAEIELRSVCFDYPGGVPVFRQPGITLALPAASIALIGENGAGKTTLTKLLNGLLRPQAGSITVAGRAVAERSVAEMASLVGYSFQNPDDQIFERTVRDEIAFGPRAMGRSKVAVEAAVGRALDRCGLKAHASIHPHDLALSERKWITIASALAADPPVVVLDEPTLGQDWSARERLAALVRSLAGEGRLVLVVTHDIDFVAGCCEMTVILTRGRVRYAGKTEEAFGDRDRIEDAGLELPSSTRLARALGADPAPVGDEAFTAWYRSRTP